MVTLRSEVEVEENLYIPIFFHFSPFETILKSNKHFLYFKINNQYFKCNDYSSIKNEVNIKFV